MTEIALLLHHYKKLLQADSSKSVDISANLNDCSDLEGADFLPRLAADIVYPEKPRFD